MSRFRDFTGYGPIAALRHSSYRFFTLLYIHPLSFSGPLSASLSIASFKICILHHRHPSQVHAIHHTRRLLSSLSVRGPLSDRFSATVHCLSAGRRPSVNVSWWPFVRLSVGRRPSIEVVRRCCGLMSPLPPVVRIRRCCGPLSLSPLVISFFYVPPSTRRIQPITGPPPSQFIGHRSPASPFPPFMFECGPLPLDQFFFFLSIIVRHLSRLSSHTITLSAFPRFPPHSMHTTGRWSPSRLSMPTNPFSAQIL